MTGHRRDGGTGGKIIRHHGEHGLVLPVVLAMMLLLLLMVGALFGVVTTRLRAGRSYQSRIDKISLHSSAVRYAVNAIRNDLESGRDGETQEWEYDSIIVTCTGDAGSGETPSGTGFTYRTVTCSSRVISSQVRFFDRSGAASGVIAEQLKWTVLI